MTLNSAGTLTLNARATENLYIQGTLLALPVGEKKVITDAELA